MEMNSFAPRAVVFCRGGGGDTVPRAVFETELNETSALPRSLVLNLVDHVRSLMGQLEIAGKPAKPDLIVHRAVDFKNYKR